MVKDQLDISNLMCFEHLIRRIIILEIAVGRNPGAPDFSGLDVVSEAPINQSGAAQVAAMNTWITERLKERANIQKQSRLYKEEHGKNRRAGDDIIPNPKKKWPAKKGKRTDDASGGAAGSASGS